MPDKNELNVLPENFYEKFKNKEITAEIIERVCGRAYEHVKTAGLTGNDNATNIDTLMLIVICQRLWSQLNERKKTC